METTEYRLGDVCKLRNGYAFKSENFTNEGVPVIRISNIKDNEATVDKALKTNPSSVFDKFAVKKGDILIAMSGATTGKFGRYISEEKAYQNQRVGSFVITDEEKLSNDYLYLLLNGLKRKIETDAYGGGQPNISSTIIENYKIHLPSIENQQLIANILSKSNGLIRERKIGFDLLDEFLKFYFLKLFGDPDKNQKRWEIKRFEDVIESLRYGTGSPPEYSETGIPFLRATNIKQGRIKKENLVFISDNEAKKIEKCKINEGDLIIVRSGVNTGDAVSIPKEYQDAYAAFDIIVTINKSSSIFYNHLINSSYGKLKIKPLTIRAGQPHINAEQIKNLKFYSPPMELQNHFATVVGKVEEIKLEYENGKRELENLLGSLTQRAFRGDLNIVERIDISGSMKIQPKISAEVIAIDNMNKQLADFHNSIAESGAPPEIDNKLKKLDAELKLRDEIPFWDEYVKYRLIKEKQTTPFTFEKLWKEIAAFPFESVPDYDTVKKMIFKLLNSDKPFLKQRFNESDKQIELLLNETTSA